MNTPISFEIAKLLKEKGFDEVCQKWYSVEGGLYYQDEFDNNRGFIPVCECEAPTIADAVMWLYEKHGIWISVSHKRHSQNKHFAYNIKQANEIETYLWEFNSPTESYEAAIKYCLENLI
jgi:hypothetical protein